MFAVHTFRKTTKQVRNTFRLTQLAIKQFTGDAQTAKAPAGNIADFPEAEKQKYRDSWGLKYNDECLKFEKEWEKVAEESDLKQNKMIENELDEYQRKKVDFIVDKILSLNIFEMRYLAGQVKTRVQRTTGMNPLKLNMDWPSIKMDSDGTWPPLNPNWFKQQELMAQVGPFMESMGMRSGGGGGGAAQASGEQEGEAKVEIKKEEKTSFDVELSGYDAKEKIKIIKEIRAILNLGLKEAKEMVEGAPIWIQRGMKKEDADKLVKTLEPLGAKLKVV
jgi:large subunit ribosomal protein L7/L12